MHKGLKQLKIELQGNASLIETNLGSDKYSYLDLVLRQCKLDLLFQ